MKKTVCIILTVCTVLCMLSGCETKTEKYDGVSVVSTSFAAFDWARQTAMDTETRVTLLSDNGTDLHSYQPTAEDMISISECDIFIYNGEDWVADILSQRKNEDMAVINLMENVSDRLICADHDESETHTEDEHIWLSLTNADILCGVICNALCERDPESADVYIKNSDSYRSGLRDLDIEYAMAVDGALNKTLIVADRFPFIYTANDYGLEYFAAFDGCSSESDASFETVAFLADKVRETGVTALFTLENSDRKLAQTVIDTSGADIEILTLDSMQSVSDTDKTYMSVMKNNLDALKAALCEENA